MDMIKQFKESETEIQAIMDLLESLENSVIAVEVINSNQRDEIIHHLEMVKGYLEIERETCTKLSSLKGE